jgi:hypothetical protein
VEEVVTALAEQVCVRPQCAQAEEVAGVVLADAAVALAVDVERVQPDGVDALIDGDDVAALQGVDDDRGLVGQVPQLKARAVDLDGLEAEDDRPLTTLMVSAAAVAVTVKVPTTLTSLIGARLL